VFVFPGREPILINQRCTQSSPPTSPSIESHLLFEYTRQFCTENIGFVPIRPMVNTGLQSQREYFMRESCTCCCFDQTVSGCPTDSPSIVNSKY
jgi:hypothetical protein